MNSVLKCFLLFLLSVSFFVYSDENFAESEAEIEIEDSEKSESVSESIFLSIPFYIGMKDPNDDEYIAKNVDDYILVISLLQDLYGDIQKTDIIIRKTLDSMIQNKFTLGMKFFGPDGLKCFTFFGAHPTLCTHPFCLNKSSSNDHKLIGTIHLLTVSDKASNFQSSGNNHVIILYVAILGFYLCIYKFRIYLSKKFKKDDEL